MKKFRLCISTFLIVIMLFTSVIVQAVMLPPEAMKEDLDIVVKAALKNHPSLINGYSQEQQKMIDDMYEKIKTEMNDWEYLFLLKKFLCSFNDGHLNISESVGTYKFIELPVVWLNEGLVVYADEGSLLKGDKILKIGGKSASEILIALRDIQPAENDYNIMKNARHMLYREAYIKQIGCEVTYDNKVQVEVMRTDGNIFTTYLPIVSRYVLPEYNKIRTWYGWQIDEKLSLAIFYLDKCQDTDEYKQALKKFFTEVKDKKIQNVAIDIRQNSGGVLTCATEFFKYIDIEFLPAFYEVQRNSIMLPESIRIQKKNEGIDYIQNVKITDSNLIFKGKLFMLISNQTFSAAHNFAMMFKYSKVGTILGEPTSNSSRLTYGATIQFNLLNTNYGLIMTRASISQKDGEDALYPDMPVYTTANDIKTGRDAQIEKLKELVTTGGVQSVTSSIEETKADDIEKGKDAQTEKVKEMVTTGGVQSGSSSIKEAELEKDKLISLSNELNAGDVEITKDGAYSFQNVTTENTITVSDGITAEIVFGNVNIDASRRALSAVDIKGSSVVKLTIHGRSVLKSGDGKAGIHVGEIGTLYINGTTGSLQANGGRGGAGIGGNGNLNTFIGAKNGEDSGNIIINGGTVSAMGGSYGAGIGGGGSAIASGGNCGNVTINGGTISAYGLSGGAGIGGGGANGYGKDDISSTGGNGGNININGGTVKASGSGSGSGIGGGGGHVKNSISGIPAALYISDKAVVRAVAIYKDTTNYNPAISAVSTSINNTANILNITLEEALSSNNTKLIIQHSQDRSIEPAELVLTQSFKSFAISLPDSGPYTIKTDETNSVKILHSENNDALFTATTSFDIIKAKFR